MAPDRPQQAGAQDYLKLAQTAMERFGVQDIAPVFIGHTEHVSFRLEAENNRRKRLLLRLHTPPRELISEPEWLSREHVESELLWLEALARDTDIVAPHPVRASGGDLVVLAPSDAHTDPIGCSLLVWVEGEPIADGVSRNEEQTT